MNFTNFSKFKTKEVNIKPFIDLPTLGTSERKAELCGFKITELYADELFNGIICVGLSWTANERAAGGFKMGVLGCKTYEWDATSLEIQFPSVKYNWYSQTRRNIAPYEIEISIQTIDGSKIKYEPMFFQNLKYGASVYFGPKGWNYLDKARHLFSTRR